MNTRTLPKDYRYAGTLDFSRNRKQIMAVLKLSLALVVLPLALGIVLSPPAISWRGFLQTWYRWALMVVMLIAYIPLHELTHGIVMYALSGVKPTYGLKLPYAYAGSTVWFDRKSHIVTALAPVVFWGIALQIAIAIAPAGWFWPIWMVQISNLSGSAGDLYCAWYLWHMPGELLIQDTGTRMRICRKTTPPCEDAQS